MTKKFLVNRHLLFFIGLLLLHCILLRITQFTAWPEMLTYPWLMSKGFHFYGDIVHPYLPLLPHILYVIYSIFGVSPVVLQWFTVIIVLSIDGLIYLIVKKLYGNRLALLSLLFFIPLQVFFEGNGMWFDLASIPFVLISFFLLLHSEKTGNKKLFLWSAVSLGLAILIKQSNAIFLLPILLQLKKWPQRITFLGFSSVSLLLISIWYVVSGQFSVFFYWGLYYPIILLSRMPGFVLFPTLKQLLLFIVVIAPLLLSIKRSNYLWLWGLSSIIFAFPRFAFFHLQHLVVFVALVLPVFFQKRRLRAFLYIYGIVIVVLSFQYIKQNTGREIRFFEQKVLHIRQELSGKIPKGEIVYFLNVPSQYFVETSMVPMKPWVDTFPWYLELPGMQEMVLNQFKTVNYIVYVPPVTGKIYELGVYQPAHIVEYMHNHYAYKDEVNGIQILVRR